MNKTSLCILIAMGTTLAIVESVMLQAYDLTQINWIWELPPILIGTRLLASLCFLSAGAVAMRDPQITKAIGGVFVKCLSPQKKEKTQC